MERDADAGARAAARPSVEGFAAERDLAQVAALHRASSADLQGVVIRDADLWQALIEEYVVKEHENQPEDEAELAREEEEVLHQLSDILDKKDSDD